MILIVTSPQGVRTGRGAEFPSGRRRRGGMIDAGRRATTTRGTHLSHVGTPSAEREREQRAT